MKLEFLQGKKTFTVRKIISSEHKRRDWALEFFIDHQSMAMIYYHPTAK